MTRKFTPWYDDNDCKTMARHVPTTTYHRCPTCDGRREVRWLKLFWRKCKHCNGHGIRVTWHAVLGERSAHGGTATKEEIMLMKTKEWSFGSPISCRCIGGES